MALDNTVIKTNKQQQSLPLKEENKHLLNAYYGPDTLPTALQILV